MRWLSRRRRWIWSSAPYWSGCPRLLRRRYLAACIATAYNARIFAAEAARAHPGRHGKAHLTVCEAAAADISRHAADIDAAASF